MTTITWNDMGYESEEEYNEAMRKKTERREMAGTGERKKRAPSQYNVCVGDFMQRQKGKIPKGDRKTRGKYFCVAAKLCSGKAKNLDEAVQICKQQHPDWKF